MSKTIIPAGYRVTIMSWENDMDACASEILEGLTKERVEFLVDLCSLFKSASRSTKTKKYYGNMYEPSESEVNNACKVIQKVMNTHREALSEDELAALDEDDLGVINDFMGDYLGDLLGRSENYWVRVFDGMKIQWVEKAITLEDVTGDFYDLESD